MHGLATNFWPTARHYAEAVQCPALCFDEPSLKHMLPAVDRLGMPLVTSGQFAYVFKLNSGGAGEMLAVRCFRGYLGDRQDRYRALDAHLNAHRITALPRFKYLPQGMLVAGRRYPVLLMQWVEGPTLDVYLDEAVRRRDALLHLADEWVRLVGALREASIAHGDLQHGNIIVERGELRLVDLDGMYVPALEGFKASEVGHQHYQHPARSVTHFSRDTDNFSALVIYLSLISLAERPELWREHHDENLLFTRSDFAEPDSSALFRKIEALGGEPARLADVLRRAALSDPSESPCLTELVSARSKLPPWVTAPADIEVSGRTREVARGSVQRLEEERPWPSKPWRSAPTTTPASASVQSIFNAPSAPHASRAQVALRDPSDIPGNAAFYAKNLFGQSYGYIWWILLHNFVLEGLWTSLGVGWPFVGMFFSFALLFTLFALYGFCRAIYDAETATPLTPPGAVMPPPRRQTSAFFNSSTNSSTYPSTGNPPTLFAAPQVPVVAANPRPVVGNRSLGIYHLPDCDWAAKITQRQRTDFDSSAAAQSAGYRPCRVCAP
ncbi:MAG: hypothetical protein QOJ76_571 [Acidobacteriota bacterium]|jgi:hypothetical protein|nr:hypothetical protein [Acidobacteriota bacterium]